MMFISKLIGNMGKKKTQSKFYANKEKLNRAKLAAITNKTKVVDEYLKLGGALQKGYGVEEV